MTMNKYFTVIFIVLTAHINLNCSIENNPEDFKLNTIDLETAINSKTTSSLGQFIKKLMYIPLETKSECLIGEIRKITCYEDNLFVLDHQGLYKFDRTGNFICKIGKRGRGPRETIMFADFFIKTDTIYIAGWNQIFAYDINSGIFLYSFHFDDKYPRNYVNKTDNYFISFNYINNLIEYYDLKGNLIDSTVYSKNGQVILDRAIGFPYYNLFFGTDISLNFTTYCNDTIFEVNDKFSLIPKYIVNLGKYKIPEKYRPDIAPWDVFINNSSSCFRKMPIETTHFLIIHLGHWIKSKGESILPEFSDEKSGISGMAIYTKMDNKITLIKKDEEKFPFFYPNFSDGKNHLLSFINPIDVISKDHQFKSKYQVNDSFVSAVKNLRINDNPIIIIAELKN